MHPAGRLFAFRPSHLKHQQCRAKHVCRRVRHPGGGPHPGGGRTCAPLTPGCCSPPPPPDPRQPCSAGAPAAAHLGCRERRRGLSARGLGAKETLQLHTIPTHLCAHCQPLAHALAATNTAGADHTMAALILQRTQQYLHAARPLAAVAQATLRSVRSAAAPSAWQQRQHSGGSSMHLLRSVRTGAYQGQAGQYGGAGGRPACIMLRACGMCAAVLLPQT